MTAPAREPDAEMVIDMRGNPTKKVITVGIGCLIAAGGVFGYLEVFTKGLDRLPTQVCSGAVQRELATRALPSARDAEERGKLLRDSEQDFYFSCYVRTSDDSTISGGTQPGDKSVAAWRRSYHGDRKASVSVGDVRVVASSEGLASVYIPCTMPGRKSSDAVEAFALVTEARTIGKTRIHGAQLRKVIAEFAYQLAQHGYKVGKCQEPRKFPDELPPLKSG